MIISKEITDILYKHGKKEAPLEACGYLAGKNNIVTKHYEMTNIDKSTDHYRLDPKEQFKVIKEARSENLEILAVYHTHPESPARPSAEDIKLAYDPNITYIIISLLKNKKDIKAFRITNGNVKKEELTIED
jgi:[CysO sulfur-carrier protein]-S-L-cysteine hydrolase